MKKKIACLAVVGVLASLACTTVSATTQVKYFVVPYYGQTFSLTSELRLPSPHYTSEYITRIVPSDREGYSHSMTLTISSSDYRRFSTSASYFTDTKGISKVIDNGSVRGYGATTTVTV